MTNRAYLPPLLVCFAMPLKTDPKSSGDGPAAKFLLTLLTLPGMGSLSVCFAQTRFVCGRSSKFGNRSSCPERAEKVCCCF